MKRKSLDAVRHLQIPWMSFDNHGREPTQHRSYFVAAWSTLGFFEIEALVRLMEMAQDPFDLRSVNQNNFLSQAGSFLLTRLCR
jgi:hypothetical protein